MQFKFGILLRIPLVKLSASIDRVLCVFNITTQRRTDVHGSEQRRQEKADFPPPYKCDPALKVMYLLLLCTVHRGLIKPKPNTKAFQHKLDHGGLKQEEVTEFKKGTSGEKGR